jgi:energy-coupling factor transport system substrate-specific component
MAVGTALYAALTIPFNVFQIPGASLVAVRPTVAIPMLFGFVFGPITGFVTGLLGNLLSDFASYGSFSWNWDIGNGLLGAIPGIGYFIVKRTDWTKVRGLATAAVLAVVASVVGIGFAAMTDYIFQIGISTLGAALTTEFYPGAGTDAVNGFILTPILLYSYARATAGRARRL